MAATVTVNYFDQELTNSIMNSIIMRAQQQSVYVPTMASVPFAKGFISEIREIINIIKNAKDREDVLAAYDEYVTIGLKAKAPLHTILAGLYSNIGINEKFKINIDKLVMKFLSLNKAAGTVEIPAPGKSKKETAVDCKTKDKVEAEVIEPKNDPMKDNGKPVIDVPADETTAVDDKSKKTKKADAESKAEGKKLSIDDLEKAGEIATKAVSGKQLSKEDKNALSGMAQKFVSAMTKSDQQAAAKSVGFDINKFITPQQPDDKIPLSEVRGMVNDLTGQPQQPVHPMMPVAGQPMQMNQQNMAPQMQPAQQNPAMPVQQPVAQATTTEPAVAASSDDELEKPEDIHDLVKEMEKYFVLIKGTHPGFTSDQIKKLLEMRKWPYTKTQLKKLGCKGTPNTVKYVEVPMETYATEEERNTFDMCFRVTAKDKKNPIIVLIDTQERQIPGAPAKTNAFCIRREK